MGRIPYFVPRELLITIVEELGPYDLNEVNLGLHLGGARDVGLNLFIAVSPVLTRMVWLYVRYACPWIEPSSLFWGQGLAV